MQKNPTKQFPTNYSFFSYKWHTENSLFLFYLKHNTQFVFQQQITKCIQFHFEVSLLHSMLTQNKKDERKRNLNLLMCMISVFSLKALEDLFILLYFSLISIGTQWIKEEIPQEEFTSLGCLVYHPDIL